MPNHARLYMRLFPNVFEINSGGELCCIVCLKVIDHRRKSTIDKHIKSEKHCKRLRNQSGKLQFLEPARVNFTKAILQAFTSANIPLYKLNDIGIRNIFLQMGYPLPSEKTCRGLVDEIYDEEMAKIKGLCVEEKIFLVVDESVVSDNMVVNVLIGLCKKPSKTYCVECVVLNESANSTKITNIIDKIIRDLEIKKENFVLLISDSAKYMIKSGQILKVFYENLFHVTCLAHLIHNCSLIIKSHYKNVNDLISSVKILIVKNKTRRKLFEEIGIPPDVVVTRWSSWLKAALFYSKKFNSIKKIVENIEDKGIIVENAKKSFLDSKLFKDLFNICNEYTKLIDIMTALESSEITIERGFKMLNEISFVNDECNIKEYISDRLKKNDVSLIISHKK